MMQGRGSWTGTGNCLLEVADMFDIGTVCKYFPMPSLESGYLIVTKEKNNLEEDGEGFGR